MYVDEQQERRQNPERMIWECMNCGAIYSWQWDYAERYERMTGQPADLHHQMSAL